MAKIKLDYIECLYRTLIFKMDFKKEKHPATDCAVILQMGGWTLRMIGL